MTSSPSPALWLHDLTLRRAQRVVPVPGGSAVLDATFAQSHDHNKLVLRDDADGARVADAADEVLGREGCAHRLVEMRTPRADAATRGLLARGYERSDELVMVWDGTATSEPAAAGAGVRELTLDQRITAAQVSWRGELPDAGEEVWRQLGARISAVVPCAQTTFLGVLAEDGSVAARADVYLRDGIAQVEEVFTEPAHRGRGHARRLVLAATEVAARAGAHTVFLVADADDWPRHLYERLGYRVIEVLPTFSRDAADS